jgi:triacylglycerol lipase
MRTRHLVDPELLPLIDGDVKLELSDAKLDEMRALLPMFYDVGPSPATVSHVSVPGATGQPDVTLVVHTPKGAAHVRPGILYIHGGGMVLGDAVMRQGIDGARAVDWDCVMVCVDYRLAPETRFPGAIEDCYAALTWMAQNAERLGVDTNRIAVMGDSAGGGLAASLAQLARDRGGPYLAAQILIYPMLDYRTGADDDPNPNPTTGEFSWTRESNRYGWSALRGDYAAADARAGHFSAALAKNLTDLPPAFIATGTLDLFFEEIMDYARRLCRAGVPTELHSYAGAVHGFDILPDAAVTKQFHTDLERAARRMLAAEEEI